MTFESILLLATAVFALALKPGPGMMMVMSRTIAQGAPAFWAFMIGFLTVTFLYLVLVFVSFNIPNLDMVFISILIKAFAALYLIWLGFKGLKNIELEYGTHFYEEQSFFENVTAAMMLTLSNPLVVVFYAGILPTMLDIHTMTLDDMLIITVVVLVIEGIVPIFYCAPFILFRKKIPVSFLKILRVFSSVVIILIGLYIGYTALPAEDLRSVF